MDAPFVQGEENSLLDVLENDGEDKPDSGLINDSLRREVQRALSTLTQREADVVTLYFGLNGEHAMTLEEIGEKFNLTRERVRQIKEKAIRRLRHTSRSKALKLIWANMLTMPFQSLIYEALLFVGNTKEKVHTRESVKRRKSLI